MRTAVYNGTRNVYELMQYAINSMAANNGADRIVVLTEDDTFPYPLPDNCEVINVVDQPWIVRGGPCWNTRWTWMVLMRACLSKILPEEDIVLSMDIDTIVDGDISELWEQDISDYYLAACREPGKSKEEPYYQMGVVLFNLKKMREDGIDDRIIHALNTKIYGFCEQDCINEICKGHIYEMDSRFNANRFTVPCKDYDVVIRHYAAESGWERSGLAQKYRPVIKAKVNTKEPAKMTEVKFEKKTYKVKAEIGDLVVLEDGRVVAMKDCKPVKEEKPKEEKPKKKAE